MLLYICYGNGFRKIMQRNVIKTINLGRQTYSAALKIQSQFERNHLNALAAGDSNANTNNTLLIIEHDPVYTIGLRTSNYTIKDEQKLKDLGAEFYKTNRGGLITFHGPGQLVIYPIINLKDWKIGMRKYIKLLEEIVIDTCRDFGLHARTTEDTGVWIDDRKVCALGVHGRRYITTHGLALNCSTDLSWFKYIVPCGVEGKEVTSLSVECKRLIEPNEVHSVILKHFSKKLDCDIIPSTNL